MAATKTSLNVVVMDVHAVGMVPCPEKMVCACQEKVVTNSLMLLQCLVLAFPVSILAVKLLAHIADFQTLMLLLPSPSLTGHVEIHCLKCGMDNRIPLSVTCALTSVSSAAKTSL